MKQLRSTDLKRLHRTWRTRTPGRLAIGLDAVQGPHNVGGVLRTAAAYRATHVWFTDAGTGPDHPQVGRTALGSERYLDVRQSLDGPALVTAARAAGYRVLALELCDAAMPIFDADLLGDICLVVGNEDHGVAPATLAACDGAVYLPQFGKIGSLNVATATAIGMYEWARQQIGETAIVNAAGPPGQPGGDG